MFSQNNINSDKNKKNLAFQIRNNKIKSSSGRRPLTVLITTSTGTEIREF